MVMVSEDFRPRWASPPGETVRASLVDLQLSVSQLAAQLDLDLVAAHELLGGSIPLTVGLAQRLSGVVGGSAAFWMAREAQYRESFDWVEADRWVSLLPHADLVNLGWVEPATNWTARVSGCLRLFDVTTPGELTGRVSLSDSQRFRARPVSERQDAAIAAWVRKVEVDATGLRCRNWDPPSFRNLLPKLAELSRMSDPQGFVPLLQELCAAVGVAVLVLRPPRNCPVSGVSLKLPSDVRVIGLSGRHLADDHFWFTFFHEAGHLLMHDPDIVFVDDIENERPNPGLSGPENEADDFASSFLLPAPILASAPSQITPVAVHGLARQARVSAGVIVGQLQHTGRISYRSKLNRLKHRYRWDGTQLTRRIG
jgi:HTH-type transcriptional regulator/antitoxin HigA